MRRRFLAALFLLSAASLAQTRAGNTITVTGKVQAALDQASYGDVVSVPAGTYRECVVLRTAGVTLQGAGMDKSRIECDGLSLKVASANDVTIKGLTFAKVGTFYKNSAVWFDGGSGTFTNNRVKVDTTASLAAFEANCTGGAWVIEDNEIVNAAQSGLYVHGYGSARIARNKIQNAGSAGIYLEELSSATVESNKIDTTGAAGIFVYNSPARIAKNDIRRAKYAGIEIKGSGMSGVIEQNWVQENTESGIFINVEAAPRVLKNVIWKNGMHGVVAKGSSPTVEDNTIVGCTATGLLAYSAATMYARRNIVVGCDKGISLTPPTGETTGSIYHSDNVFWRNKWGNFQQITRDPTDLELDPDFVSESAGDFHLRGGSPIFSRSVKYGAYGSTAAVGAAVTRTSPPPNLEVTAAFDDSRGNGDRVLDANESATLVLRVRNSARGPGLEVKAQVLLKYDNANVTVGPMQTLGKVEQGDNKVVEISVAGGEELQNGEVELNAQVRERDGFDAEPIVIRLKTRSRAMPELRLVKYNISDTEGARSSGNGNGKIEKGELIEVRANIANKGLGGSEGVKVALVSGVADVIIMSQPTELGAMGPGTSKEASLSFSVNRRYAASPKLPLTLQITEGRRRGEATETLELTLDSSAPQGRVLDMTAGLGSGNQGAGHQVSGPAVFEGANTGQGRKAIVGTVEGQMAPTILVLDILTKSKKVDSEVLTALSDRVRGVIVKSGYFRVVSRDQMDAIMKEQKFGKSEACDETSCYAEMGRALGARYMAAGNLALIGKTYTLNLQLVDVEKVVTINNANKDCKACEVDDLLPVADGAAGDLILAK